MNIIQSTKLSVCWKGQSLPTFQPSRGLRQGDPLSPYLFVLCMEVLSQKISREVDLRQWKPISLSKDGPPVSHLFFADDLLLVGEASFSQARVMEHLLEDFCVTSGQRVNRRKSTIWFSPKTPSYLRNSICSNFGIIATSTLGIYLGVPLEHGRRRVASYQYIVDKVRKHLASWKIKSLSKAAR